MPEPGSWDILDEDFTDISDWTDGDGGTGVSQINPAGQLELLSGASDGYAYRYRFLAAYPSTFTLAMKITLDALNLSGAADYFEFRILDGGHWLNFRVAYSTATRATISVYDDAGWTTSAASIKINADAQWLWLWAVVDRSSHPNDTCDVFYSENEITWAKILDGAACHRSGAATVGQTEMNLWGYDARNQTAHLDYLKIATGLYFPVAEIPTVTTQEVSIIIPGGATLNGNITDYGDASISEHGFAWKAGADPVNIAGADGHSDLGAGAEGAFDQAKTGLAEATEFYVRAYATNSEGDGYGAAVSFTTGQTHSAVVALAPAAGVAVEGHLISSGVAAIVPAVGVAASAGRLTGGAVAIAAALGMVVTSNWLASARVAISAGADVSANPSNTVYGEASIGPGVGVSADANAIFSGQVTLTPDATAEIIANYITHGDVALTPGVDLSIVANYITIALASLAVEASVSGAPTRVRFGAAGITVSVAVSAAATKYLLTALGLSGDLAPGSVIEIDSENFTFKVDGVNALKDMVGDWYNVPPGDSWIEYDDDEGARTVAVDVTYTPRDA